MLKYWFTGRRDSFTLFMIVQSIGYPVQPVAIIEKYELIITLITIWTDDFTKSEGIKIISLSTYPADTVPTEPEFKGSKDQIWYSI